MTRQQELQVARIKKQTETYYGKCQDNYEIKKWEVEETDYGKVIVNVEMGLKNDEGTLASIIGRDYTMIFIGVRGGMEVPSRKKNKDFIFRSVKSLRGAIYDYMYLNK